MRTSTFVKPHVIYPDLDYIKEKEGFQISTYVRIKDENGNYWFVYHMERANYLAEAMKRLTKNIYHTILFGKIPTEAIDTYPPTYISDKNNSTEEERIMNLETKASNIQI